MVEPEDEKWLNGLKDNNRDQMKELLEHPREERDLEDPQNPAAARPPTRALKQASSEASYESSATGAPQGLPSRTPASFSSWAEVLISADGNP